MGFLYFFFEIFIYLFLEMGRGEREKLMCERNIDWLPLTHAPTGDWPATQACALTGNQTVNPLVLRPALNPPSHTSQGSFCFLFLMHADRTAVTIQSNRIVSNEIRET